MRNRTGDTAQGLIVLKVVRGAVPDFPVVTDTTLTAETRENLAGGVDVVAGKVSWTGGDVSSLKLSLWGDANGMSVSGSRISGPLPKKSLIVPFQLTGTSFSGTEVTSYGFLRIPGDDDIQLTLRTSFPEVQVNEKASVEVDMSQAVAFPTGQTLQVGTTGLAASGARAQATCSLVSGTTIRYDAGAGAPYTDVCTVPVKLASQEDYTFLALRITVIAEAPQPQLRAASLSVSPGSQTTYDLTGMTTWQGTSDFSSLQYAAAYSGDQFTVVQQGQQLTVTAKDASRPGREEPVIVKITNYPDAAAATLVLTVGPAPSTLPKGGTATQQCSQSGGNASCTIQVIGAGGEVNPLPGTPLTLVSVTGPSNCRGVTFTQSGSSAVTASWSADAPGAGDCTGSFVVQDAQGRQSSGDRNGTIILDLHGLPADPTRLNWTAYDGKSVTLAVVSEGSSYPAVTGYRVSGGGQQVTCSAAGVCPPIPAATTTGGGTQFQAWAVNSVGESRNAVSRSAWAYQAPDAPTSVTSEPTGDGIARVTVAIADSSTGSVKLRYNGTESGAQPVSGGVAVFDNVNVGSNATPVDVTAVPLTQNVVPPADVAAGSSEGKTTTGQAWGIGKPAVALSFIDGATSGFRGSVTVTATVAQSNAGSGSLYIGFGSSPDANDCTPSVAIDGRTGQASKTYSNVGIIWPKTYYGCAEYRYQGNSFGVTVTSTAHAITGSSIPKPTGDATYTIELGGKDGNATRTASLTHKPSLSAGDDGFEVVYYADGGQGTTDFTQLISGLTSAADITAKTCTTDGGSCSDSVAVTSTTAARYLVQLTFAATCGEQPSMRNPNTGAATTHDDWSFTAPTAAAPTGTVTFKNDLAAFGTATREYSNCVPAGGGTGGGGTGGGGGGTGGGGTGGGTGGGGSGTGG
ncbi:hypothetical protein QE381_001285 [Microbacterium sp. SORGH_AS 888]|nr:hypothetical protein [Microbacterium sp. SORGH_AS_0888]